MNASGQDLLLIASVEGLENLARVLEEQLSARVEVAAGRKEGLSALRRGRFDVVVVEEALTESDPGWADQVWELAGFAIPMQVNFALSGAARLVREIKAALARRVGEQVNARRAAASEIEDDLRSSLTGLLLQSELALREPSVTASLEPKLRHVVQLAGAIRERLQREGLQREGRGRDVGARG